MTWTQKARRRIAAMMLSTSNKFEISLPMASLYLLTGGRTYWSHKHAAIHLSQIMAVYNNEPYERLVTNVISYEAPHPIPAPDPANIATAGITATTATASVAAGPTANPAAAAIPGATATANATAAAGAVTTNAGTAAIPAATKFLAI